MSEHFAESWRTVELQLRRGGTLVHATGECGQSTQSAAGGDEALEWIPGIEQALPPGKAFSAGARAHLSIPPLEHVETLRRVASALQDAATAAGLFGFDLGLRHHDRRTSWTARAVERCDRQTWTLVELRAHARRGDEARFIQREAAFADPVELEAALPELVDLVSEAAQCAAHRLDDLAVTPAELPVIVPPGADAAVLFHELCGHPLEGDVVLRRASFLAERRGAAVAFAHLTVVDSPQHPRAVQYAFDDEGVPAQEVTLIRRGEVHQPLLDRRTAAALDLEPNGHGRRASYRHPALPRMAHTAVLPFRGELKAIMGEVNHGVLVRYLTPRHVNLMTGDFSFYVAEAQEIVHGVAGRFLRPALLRGNALRALERIDAVGADAATFFGLKGCGKLNQGGLPVSFGNPTVRFSRLRLEPAR